MRLSKRSPQTRCPHYGISTGFGALATKHIPVERRAQLQRSLIRSHAAGSGPEVEREVVRALMLLRLSTLATGRTGVRPIVAETYAALLNAGITPVVHGVRQPRLLRRPRAAGALRAGADWARAGARRRAASCSPPPRRSRAAGIDAVALAGEGGPRAHQRHRRHARHAVLAITRPATRCSRTADIAAAMSVEALLGTDRVFAADLQALRPQPGQAVSAANMRALLAGSPIVASHRGADSPACRTPTRCAARRRCTARRATPLDHAAAVAGRELASADRQPGVTLDGRVESNGNFHGAPVALRARLPRDRRRRSGEHERAAHRPLPRRGAQPRAAAVPRRRPGRRLRAHDRPVHAGRHRLAS